jgi:hypothetical protein
MTESSSSSTTCRLTMSFSEDRKHPGVVPDRSLKHTENLPEVPFISKRSTLDTSPRDGTSETLKLAEDYRAVDRHKRVMTQTLSGISVEKF